MRVDQFSRAEGSTAAFALVTIGILITAIRTSTDDIAIRKKLTSLLIISLLFAISSNAQAFNLEESLQEIATGEYTGPATDLQIAQRGGGKSLSEAVESVRRQGNVERIVSATTRIEGNREVHHIRYMTKDGKVRTTKVPGRRRD